MSKSAFGLTALCALAVVPAAAGKMAPPPAMPLRAAPADAVVLGKVTAVAAKAEKAELYKGDTREMTFATVKVESALLGKPGKTVKVGFLAPLPPKGKRKRPAARLSADQEACLFLLKLPTKKGSYYLANYYDVVGKNVPGWKEGVEEVKKAAKLLAAPMKGLKSKDAGERALTAILLIFRYKAPVYGSTKTEAVPAAESKLILTALAEADWDARPGGGRELIPQAAFSRLGLTALDGWKTPRDYAELTKNAKAWLKDNAAKYEMTRSVREKLSPSEEPDQ